MNIKSIEKELKIIWDYMVLDEDFPKCDLIIGCGCQSLTIPITCANLYKQGYADKIIFAGGLGKITKYHFKKAEAEMYKEIAIQEGVPEEKIWIENKSTNTGDNFRFSKKIIDEENWNIKNILIVHNKFSERRTLSAAKAIIKDKELYITSAKVSFDDFIQSLQNKEEKRIIKIVSSMVGDIQRMIIFPHFGWQIKQEVPQEVQNAYRKLKSMGFDEFVISKEKIKQEIEKYGIIEKEPILWD